MAVSVRAPSESNKYRNSKSELKFGQSNQLKELFKNDMINLNVLPKIRPDPQNYSRLNQLESLVDVFDDIVDRASVSTNSYSRICCYFICCCKCVCFRNKCRRYMNQTIYRSSNEVVFGELTQSKLIMERNFEGKQFIIRDPQHRHPNIDCMFFPSTEGDDIIVDPDVHAKPRTKSFGK